MTVLIVIACILLALFLLLLLRIGAKVEYGEAGAAVWVKAGPFSVRVFPPRKGRKKRARPPKKEREAPASVPKGEKKGGNLALVKELLPLAAEAAGRFKEKIRVDRLYLDVVWAGGDPAAAALGFGYANAAVGMLWPLLEHNFDIRQRRIRTKVDFQQTKPTVYLYLEASLRLGQAGLLGISLLVKFLKLYRARQRAQHAVQEHQKEAV